MIQASQVNRGDLKIILKPHKSSNQPYQPFLSSLFAPIRSCYSFQLHLTRILSIFSQVSAMYDIMNYRNDDGDLKYVRVGTWKGEKVDGKLRSKLELLEDIKWLQGVSSPPASYCSGNCNQKYETPVHIPTFDYHCCWECKKCNKLQIVQNNTCVDGPLGLVPNSNGTGWMKRELVYPKWDDNLSIAMILLSFVSLVLTSCILAFYIKYKYNRFIKASGRELCFVQLTGIALCFSVSVLFIAKPGGFVCNARYYISGLSLVLCYAPLFMKVNRIYRIFTNARISVARPSLVSPRTQLLITFAFIGVQLLFTTFTGIVNPIAVQEFYNRHREELLLECHTDDLGFILNLTYVMFLMFLCTVYAFKTRNFPRNYNESKIIGITMYITFAVWVVYFPLAHKTAHSLQQVYLTSSAYLVIGLVTLIGLFSQKVYVVFCVTDVMEENLSMPTGASISNPMSKPNQEVQDNGSIEDN